MADKQPTKRASKAVKVAKPALIIEDDVACETASSPDLESFRFRSQAPELRASQCEKCNSDC